MTYEKTIGTCSFGAGGLQMDWKLTPQGNSGILYMVTEEFDLPQLSGPEYQGEWNTTKIIVNKGHVEHWLNGQKTAGYELWTPEWKKHKEEGKWKNAKGYGLSKKGHIALQDHGSEIWFRNVKIKEL